MNSSLGNRLRYFRKVCRFTQQSISETLGIDRTTYSNYERDISYPDARMCNTLAKIFGISISELMGEENSRTSYFHDTERYNFPDIPTAETPQTLHLTELTKEERHLICLFRSVSSDQKNDLLLKASNYSKENIKNHP